MPERNLSPSGPVTVEPDVLEAYAGQILRAMGAASPIARRVARSLVTSNLVGHDSHGILLLTYYADLIERGQIRPAETMEIIQDRGAVATLDGHFGFGQIAGQDAVQLAVERARRYGVSCLIARNANHLARLGEYTGALAEAGLVGMLFVNCQGSGQLVPPHGGTERRLTNNPISLAAPGDTHPVLLDMALGLAAEAKVWLARARGQPIPEDWVLDAGGHPTTDPDDLFDGGVLLPLGGVHAGHKGYGLIVLVEILAGILSGGGTCRPNPPSDFSNAFVMLAIDVEPLVAREDYVEHVKAFRAYVTSARCRPDVERILIPGDFEAESRARRQQIGIKIERKTWDELAHLATKLDVAAPRFATAGSAYGVTDYGVRIEFRQ